MFAKPRDFIYLGLGIALFLFLLLALHFGWFLALIVSFVCWIIINVVDLLDPELYKGPTPPKFEIGQLIAITTPQAPGAGPILERKWERRKGWSYLVKDSHNSYPKPGWVHESNISK